MPFCRTPTCGLAACRRPECLVRPILWQRSVRTETIRPDTVSLAQLDAFLAHARRTPALQARLAEPLELEAFLALASQEGYAVEERDVLAARERDESQCSAAELQQRAGADARRLRSFIPG